MEVNERGDEVRMRSKNGEAGTEQDLSQTEIHLILCQEKK